MQTQSEPRLRKRLHCTLNVDARRHNGLILNLSRRGMFVQTSMPAEPGTLLEIDVRDPVRGDDIPVQAAVVWRKRVPARMKGTNESGMGLRLISRPDAWQTMMSGMLESGDESDAQAGTAAAAVAPEPVAAPAPVPTFVVRLGQPGGPRSRRLWVQAESEESARREALARAGHGWTILELARR